MSERIDYSQLGGLLFYQDTVDFMQHSYRTPLSALSKFLGEKYVAYGCVEAGGVVSDGAIVVNGELIPFTGGAVAAQIVITETVQQEGYDDGTIKDVFYSKTAGFGLAGGFAYSELKRLPFNAASISECAANINRVIKSIVQFEPEVILEGCAVTDVTTGPNTCNISAGLILFDGKLISSPAYSGTYPAYLKEDGGWVTAVPGAGFYITFNPHTSQRYKNVLDRAITPAGQIKIFETLTDRFNAGVGRWEMKGYELAASLQNRVPVGLWFDGVAVADVSNVTNQTPGNAGGKNTHALSISEMPAHSHSLQTASSDGGFGVFDDASGPTGTRNTSSVGGGVAHENRQPFRVVVYAKRSV